MEKNVNPAKRDVNNVERISVYFVRLDTSLTKKLLNVSNVRPKLVQSVLMII